MAFKNHRTISLIFIIFVVLSSQAQNYISPLKIPLYLSANFGELRNNHFHSGLDFKTQGQVNKPVYAVADGYVSRINVSAGGYGLALYITHPDGYTSVYGHLNRYSQKIEDYIFKKQYEKESYYIDYMLQPGEIPVEQGEQIALSGNTGGSGGPHLHFEIRDTKSEDPIDPMDFVGSKIADTQAPVIYAVAYYPIESKGLINGNSKPIYYTKAAALKTPVTAWGEIGIGIKAYDKMNGTPNIYGVKNIKLFVDSQFVFSSNIDRFSFSNTRMINSYIDFAKWRNEKSFYVKSYVEPGNTLPVYEKSIGYININQEKKYTFKYILEDAEGNSSSFSFNIVGKKQELPDSIRCNSYLIWNENFNFMNTDFNLNIPKGNLFTNYCFNLERTSSNYYYSDIYLINNSPIPLANSGKIWIQIKKKPEADYSKLGIVKIEKNGKQNWIGGTLERGGISTDVKELGDKYAIDIDTEKPVIFPLQPLRWASLKKISIKVTDGKSGIASYRGEIDGKYALFTHDIKSDYYFYTFDNDRLSQGENHTLKFRVKDNTGNEAEYMYVFYY